MSNIIKVPYMPISDFKIPDEFLEEIDELNDDENSTLELPSTDIPKNLLLVLHGMGMEKYEKVFSEQKITLDTFLKLNEADLKELGIRPGDIQTILTNLGTANKTSDSEFIVKENHLDDLQIVRNVSQQLTLVQCYCAYVQLQMKKKKLTDYKVNSEEFASLYLKKFTEAALLQSRILSSRIYNEDSDNALIDEILKMYNLSLPPVYQKALPEKKRKGSSTIKKVITIIGVSSLIIIIRKLLINKNINA